jgi:hypothetical protein
VDDDRVHSDTIRRRSLRGGSGYVPTLSKKDLGICVGKWGLLERLGVASPQSGDRIHTHDVVPWSAVVSASRRSIVIRGGTKPK